jgi:choline kinase
MPVRDAIILAAGVGARLRGVVDDRPKGLIEIGGETLVGRSVRLLRGAGVERITIVAGFQAGRYTAFAAGQSGLHVLVNPAFETTGSMASLDVGLEAIQGRDVLVLESDIAYEARALDLAAQVDQDATIVSGPTGAGDEVWVSAPDGWLLAMSKIRADLPSVEGEFVGITRLSPAGASAMRAAFHAFFQQHGHGRMDYETGGLVGIAANRAVRALFMPDLCWGEVDDERQLVRVISDVWPAIGGPGRVQ